MQLYFFHMAKRLTSFWVCRMQSAKNVIMNYFVNIQHEFQKPRLADEESSYGWNKSWERKSQTCPSPRDNWLRNASWEMWYEHWMSEEFSYTKRIVFNMIYSCLGQLFHMQVLCQNCSLIHSLDFLWTLDLHRWSGKVKDVKCFEGWDFVICPREFPDPYVILQRDRCPYSWSFWPLKMSIWKSAITAEHSFQISSSGSRLAVDFPGTCFYAFLFFSLYLLASKWISPL